jgi:hypothetical protein
MVGCSAATDFELITGAYTGCLCEAELASSTEVKDMDTWLTLELSTTDDGESIATLFLDGSITVFGYLIRGNDETGYILEDLRLSETKLRGKIRTEGAPALKIVGEFTDNEDVILFKAGRLGEMWLDLV